MEQLGALCRTSGIGPFPGDGYPQQQDQGALRLRRTSTNWILWSRAKGSKRHSIKPAFIHWLVDCNGHGSQSNQGARIGQVCAKTQPNARRNEQGRPCHRKEIASRIRCPKMAGHGGHGCQKVHLYVRMCVVDARGYLAGTAKAVFSP